MSVEKAKVFLLGVIAALLAVLVFNSRLKETVLPVPVYAAEGGGGSGVTAIRISDSEFAVFDGSGMRIAVYEYKRDQLRLKAARNVQYDLRVESEVSSSRGLTYEDVQRRRKN